MPSKTEKQKQKEKTQKQVLAAEVLLLLLLRRTARKLDKAAFALALRLSMQRLRRLGRASVLAELKAAGEAAGEASVGQASVLAELKAAGGATVAAKKSSVSKDFARAAAVAAAFLLFAKSRAKSLRQKVAVAETAKAVALRQKVAVAETAKAVALRQKAVAETAKAVALLKQQADVAIDNKLRQIAAAEAIRAFEAERRVTAQQIADAHAVVSKQRMTKRWDASMDAVTCPVCAALEGLEINLAEEFPEGDPPLHPNCRCSVEYKFDMQETE